MKMHDTFSATGRVFHPATAIPLTLALVGVASLAIPAAAQAQPGKGSAASSRSAKAPSLPAASRRVAPSGNGVSRTDYVIGPDDVLQIRVRNHDMDMPVTVRPDGKISFPRAGEVLAAGKTAQALERHLQRLLERSLNNARVEIEVKEAKSRQARVTGAVKTVGTYNLKPNWRVMDVVALAGGLTTKPTRVIGQIYRSGQVIPFNIEQAVAHPAGPANVLLRPDDLIILTERDISKQVTVTGAIATPGAFDLEENLTIVSLIARAGGVLPSAALRKSQVVRNGVPIPLDLYGVLVEGVPNPQVTSFQFQPGDLLMIAENQSRFGVQGFVTKTGYYPLPERRSEATLLKALSQAGGPAVDGDLQAATLTRNIDGSNTTVPVDLSAMLKGRVPDNVMLQADDVLYVPKRNNTVHVLGQVTSPGDYDLQENMNLLSLLSEAGSPKEGAGLAKSYVLRDNVQIPINLYALLREGKTDDPAATFQLKPGDVLVVPDVSNQITVIGQVTKPGSFSLDEGLTPVELVARAGSATDKAALSKAHVLRDNQQIQLDLHGVLTEGRDDPAVMSFRFQPGDVLVIPENKVRFAVLGQVGRPGYYPFPERTGQASVLNALSAAGGPLQQGREGGADLKNAGIIRSVNGKATRLPVDLAAILRDGGGTSNVQLQPEDVLYIPSRKPGFNWQGILQAVPLIGYF